MYYFSKIIFFKKMLLKKGCDVDYIISMLRRCKGKTDTFFFKLNSRFASGVRLNNYHPI